MEPRLPLAPCGSQVTSDYAVGEGLIAQHPYSQTVTMDLPDSSVKHGRLRRIKSFAKPVALIVALIVACIAALTVVFAVFTCFSYFLAAVITSTASFLESLLGTGVPPQAKVILDFCAALKVPAGPPEDFNSRTVSDRYTPGTPSTIIYDARIWTGENNGTEVVDGFVWLDRGIVVAVGGIEEQEMVLKKLGGARNHGLSVNFVDAGWKWVTPGLGELPICLGAF
jgi:hypothetical protein